MCDLTKFEEEQIVRACIIGVSVTNSELLCFSRATISRCKGSIYFILEKKKDQDTWRGTIEVSKR